MPMLSDAAFDALKDAVTIARDRQILTVKLLRVQLAARGHHESDITAAIECWAGRLQTTGIEK